MGFGSTTATSAHVEGDEPRSIAGGSSSEARAVDGGALEDGAASDPNASTTVRLGSTLDRDVADGALQRLDAVSRARGSGRLIFDLSGVESFDSAGMGAVVRGVRQARSRGMEVRMRGVSPAMRDFLSLVHFGELTAPTAEEAPRVGWVTRLGESVLPGWFRLCDLLQTARDVFVSLAIEPIRGRRPRVDRLLLEVDHAACGALPIIALIAFLLGLILAMQAWVQLRLWGAEIYMADMVGVSVITEIGPLMTAIVLAARSGSANAAQLGSMVVSEELDALKQMGIDAMRYLVVPKVLALGCAAVGLTLLFDAIALVGGVLFAGIAADIEPGAYWEQTRNALHASDFAVSLIKSLTFGFCVGVVGCGLGLRVSGGSAGVAKATTQAVVLSVFLVIVLDAVFVVLWQMFRSGAAGGGG